MGEGEKRRQKDSFCRSSYSGSCVCTWSFHPVHSEGLPSKPDKHKDRGPSRTSPISHSSRGRSGLAGCMSFSRWLAYPEQTEGNSVFVFWWFFFFVGCFCFCFVFLGLQVWHVEVPRLGVQSEL